MYTLYQHKNKINNKIYIGITMQNPYKRFGSNGSNYKSSPYFYNAIQKYGWGNFEHNILFENLTKAEACLKEKELIKTYDSMNRKLGYNSTSGGEMFEISEEIRLKKSKSMLGNKNGLGKKCSKEKAKKISESQKGRKLSDKHKQKLSISAKKRHTICSDDKKETLRNNYPKMKQVYCLETDTIYKSVQDCGRQLNLYATNITKVCKGIHKTTGGLHFKYYNDVINA